MRSLLLAAGFFITTSAMAETRIFIVDNMDGYEIDRCLAAGEPCGAHAAAALCHTRQFAKAVEYGKVDPKDVTGSAPNAPALPKSNIVAVTCSR
jgi:hypothetical protein